MDTIARKHSIEAHRAVNHYYDGSLDYQVHLDMAVHFAKLFIHLIPEKDRKSVIAGVYEHDTIEDCGLTYNDVKKVTNEMVAELAYACTNEKGRNRAERANDKYYEGIRNTKYATFVKLCDRLANVKYSTNGGSRMADLYRRENDHFKSMLYTGEYYEMWDLLDELLKK
jgi:(p)ppGpp synthase/HD superfamily hydrolase